MQTKPIDIWGPLLVATFCKPTSQTLLKYSNSHFNSSHSNFCILSYYKPRIPAVEILGDGWFPAVLSGWACVYEISKQPLSSVKQLIRLMGGRAADYPRLQGTVISVKNRIAYHLKQIQVSLAVALLSKSHSLNFLSVHSQRKFGNVACKSSRHP